MPASRKTRQSSWLTVLLVIAAVAIWAYEQKHPEARKPVSTRQDPPASGSSSGKLTETPRPDAQPPIERQGIWQVYRNSTLEVARNNDGDSFQVELSPGRLAEFRLYFVDTPESAFKTYSDGDDNHQRIAEQARDLGGITPDQAVKIGQDAKRFTLDLLASRPFTLYTIWDSPYNDARYHAFIQVTQNGKTRWLDEILVEKGYVRIYTKGTDLPDGTPANSWKARLKSLEATARSKRVGAWAY